MNSARFGVVGVADGKDSGKVPGPRKLEPARRLSGMRPTTTKCSMYAVRVFRGHPKQDQFISEKVHASFSVESLTPNQRNRMEN